MQEAGLISDYLESIADALSFDRSLSRRVRQEVEDHLREAAAADPIGDRLEAERRAIASFGASHAIAAQFAIVSLAKHTRRVGAAAIVVIAAVFAAMKAPVFNPRYRQQLRRSFLLCAAAGGLLVVSVISDGALTAFRLSGAEVCAGFIVPLVSMTIEIVCAGVLVFQIRAMLRRATSTAALLKT